MVWMDIDQDGDVKLEHVAPPIQISMYAADLSKSTSGLVVNLAAQVNISEM
jgi:hypothetical protein